MVSCGDMELDIGKECRLWRLCRMGIRKGGKGEGGRGEQGEGGQGQGRTVVFRPPAEMSSPDNVLEDESDDCPRDVIDGGRGRY